MPESSKRRLTGILLAMAAALAWSSGGVAIKLLPLSAPSISGFRSLFALPVLFLALLLGRLRAVESLLAATLEPVLNPVWVALWAHEQPGRPTLLGGAVILATVVLHGLYTNRSSRI